MGDTILDTLKDGTQVTQVSGTVATTGSGLTDAQLRASPVPVSGPLTDSQLRANNVPVKDDYSAFETQKVTLSAGVDTTITFSGAMRLIRVSNFDLTNVVLVKNGVISSNTDATASIVSVSPILNISSSEVFPFATSTIHVRSAGASVITVEGFS